MVSGAELTPGCSRVTDWPGEARRIPAARGALSVTGPVTPLRMGVATAALVTLGTMTLLPGWIMVMLAPGPGLLVTTAGLTLLLLTRPGFRLLTVGILE